MTCQNITMDDEQPTIAASRAVERPTGSQPDVAVDFGALICPMLGLKSIGVLRSLERGQMLEITTSSPSSVRSLRRIAWMTKSRFVKSYKQDGSFRHLLRKA